MADLTRILTIGLLIAAVGAMVIGGAALLGTLSGEGAGFWSAFQEHRLETAVTGTSTLQPLTAAQALLNFFGPIPALLVGLVTAFITFITAARVFSWASRVLSA